MWASKPRSATPCAWPPSRRQCPYPGSAWISMSCSSTEPGGSMNRRMLSAALLAVFTLSALPASARPDDERRGRGGERDRWEDRRDDRREDRKEDRKYWKERDKSE